MRRSTILETKRPEGGMVYNSPPYPTGQYLRKHEIQEHDSIIFLHQTQQRHNIFSHHLRSIDYGNHTNRKRNSRG